MSGRKRAPKGFAVGQRVRILGLCARVLNRGTIVAADHEDWFVRPDGCGRVRFSRASLVMLPNPPPFHRFPRIAYA